MSELERSYFPSWRLGYRSNPFRALTPHEWRAISLVPGELQDLIDTPPALTQVLGDQGSGKTSLLLALERGLLEKGWSVAYEYLPLGAQNYKTDTTNLRVFLLDETQRLSAPVLNRLLSSASSSAVGVTRLILATHRDLSGFAADHRVPIRSVELDTHAQSFTQAIIETRLKYFERPGYQGVRLTPAALSHLIAHCGSNLRRLEWLLYEAYQTWDVAGPISADYLRELIDRLV